MDLVDLGALLSFVAVMGAGGVGLLCCFSIFVRSFVLGMVPDLTFALFGIAFCAWVTAWAWAHAIYLAGF